MDKNSGSSKISRRRLIGIAAAGLVTGAAGGTMPAHAEEQAVIQKSNAKLTRIHPGIWRVRLGTPETATPLTFRIEQPADGLNALPLSDKAPFEMADIGFKTTGRGCAVTLPMSKTERIYGLGMNTKLFDKTDRRVFLRPMDNAEDDMGDSHAPVPFYVSTAGYGVYVDTARYASFYTGNVAPAAINGPTGAAGGFADSTQELYRQRILSTKTMLVDIPSARGVDVYIFGGPTLLDAVRRYNLFSGGGAVPPLWGLGVAYRGCGNFDAEKSLKLAQSLRDQHMPCDIWGLEPGWQQKAYSCSFTWNEQSFPDPDGFMKSIQSMGYRTSFWEHAFTHSSSPIHDALKPFSGDYLVWDGLVPDFATAGAQKIFEEHHEKVLFSKGADSVKLDECDNQPDSATPWSFPEAAEFPSGIDGERYHSLFGTLYQHTMMAPLQKRNRRTWGLVRNSHALAAPSPYVIYSDNYDFDCYVRGLANAGFSGLLWTPEVRDAGSVEELCRRVATVVMSPYAMINAWYIPMPPWVQINREKNGAGEAMPEQDEATNAVRSLLRLRMSLVPYLYSAFNDYAKSGTPPVRAIVMDWPDDDEARKIDDQFLVGPSLLVAPMFPGQSSRSVYLPSGKWYDFWTGDAITGPAHLANVSCPLDRVPVYVRDNALLPLADPVEHIAPDTVFSLTVRVYGEIPKPFALFADDGVSNDYKNDIQDQLTLSWAAGTGHVASSGKYRGPARYQVAQWTKV